MYSEKYKKNIMSHSLNCLVLGQAPTNIFTIFFGEYIPIRNFQVKFDELDVSEFKEALIEKTGITVMNVWKIELGFDEINNYSNEDDIKNHDKSEKIDDNPLLKFNTYYNNKDKKPNTGYLHIFIVPTSTVKHALPIMPIVPDIQKCRYIALTSQPQSEQELIQLLFCVLTALKDLHKSNYMHRDIQLKNIIKSKKNEWHIIVSGHCCRFPEESSYKLLDYDNHAPEMYYGYHDASVDIWSVGFIIKNNSQDQRLIQYSKQLMDYYPSKRPTAKQACTWLWDNYKENLMEENFSRES